MYAKFVAFRGAPNVAGQYFESESGQAVKYYVPGEDGRPAGRLVMRRGQDPVLDTMTRGEYEKWVGWADPKTGVLRGAGPRSGEQRSSALFHDIPLTVNKSLALAAGIDESGEISAVLNKVMHDAAEKLACEDLAAFMVTRVGSIGRQRLVRAAQWETALIRHETSRAGDPHPHIHFQVLNRVMTEDGKWHSLYSTPMYRANAFLNTRFEQRIAADPRLAEVLARHGYTWDTLTGDVLELTAPVPGGKGESFADHFSKRKAQIERIKEGLLAQWQTEHPGQTPDLEQLKAWDRYAWAKDRPDKVKKGEAAAKEGTAEGWREELAALGWEPPTGQGRAVTEYRDLGEFLEERLGMMEARHVAFRVTEYEALIEKAVHYCGVDALEVEAALAGRVRLLHNPENVSIEKARILGTKVFTTERVMRVEADVTAMLEGRAQIEGRDGDSLVLEVSDHALDAGQKEAAAAMTGSHSVVVVEGVAGSGKTTALKVVEATMRAKGQTLAVVAPTGKAAGVAAGELEEADSSSLHKLLWDHGWRWDDNGRMERTGEDKGGLLPDLLVVDEAGMLDMESARAMLTLTAEHGTRVALVGDTKQLGAVARGGAMRLTKSYARSVEMLEAHRFEDPEYAAVAAGVREGLATWEQVEAQNRAFEDSEALVAGVAEQIAQAPAAWCATAPTNDTVAAINQAVQQIRLERGDMDANVWAQGRDGDRLHVGDQVQNRQNNKELGLFNRDNLTIAAITDTTIWAMCERTRTQVAIPRAFAAENLGLGYASTVHGGQGVTARRSITVLDDHSDRRGLYVGITRGKKENLIATVGDGQALFEQAMARPGEDYTLAEIKAISLQELSEYTLEEEAAQQPEPVWEQLRPGGRAPTGRRIKATKADIGQLAVPVEPVPDPGITPDQARQALQTVEDQAKQAAADHLEALDKAKVEAQQWAEAQRGAWESADRDARTTGLMARRQRIEGQAELERLESTWQTLYGKPVRHWELAELETKRRQAPILEERAKEEKQEKARRQQAEGQLHAARAWQDYQEQVREQARKLEAAQRHLGQLEAAKGTWPAAELEEIESAGYEIIPLANGTRVEWRDERDRLHREDGPARVDVDFDGNTQAATWYHHGQQIPPQTLPGGQAPTAAQAPVQAAPRQEGPAL